MKTAALRTLLLAAATFGLVGAGPAPRYALGTPIAGPDGGWDYASVDPVAGRLYVARSASVTAIDLDHGAPPQALGTIARGHAVVPVPGLLMVTSGGDNSVRLLDPADGRQVAQIAVDANPDAAFYDAASGRAVVMNARAGTVAVIDLAARRVTRTIALKPGLEFAQPGPGNTLFVNNEDANEIDVADLATGAVGAPIALTGCTSPSGLAYDAASHVLIAACANGKAAVVDAVAKRVTGLLDIGQGPDAVILDAARRLAFIPCGRSGTLSVIALDGTPAVVATVATAVGARTGALDPRSGAIYLPTAEYDPPAAPGKRPTPRPGTFRIVVVKPVA